MKSLCRDQYYFYQQTLRNRHCSSQQAFCLAAGFKTECSHSQCSRIGKNSCFISLGDDTADINQSINFIEAFLTVL